MAHAETTLTAVQRLRELASGLDAHEGFAQVVEALKSGHAATLDGVWGSSCALVAAALKRQAPAPIVAVLPHAADIDALVDDVRLFCDGPTASFPPWETAPDEARIEDETIGERIRLLKTLNSPHPPPLIVTSIQALLQPVPDPDSLAAATRRLATREAFDLDELLAWLVEGNYHATSAVELPGEFSRRGGILDLFACDWEHPVRIELFGDEVDSIRHFDVGTQRSLNQLDSVDVTRVGISCSGRGHFVDHVPAQSWFLLVEPVELESEARHWLERLDDPNAAHGLHETWRRVFQFPSVTAQGIAASSLEATARLRVESVERFSGDLSRVRSELEAVGAGQEVVIVCQTEAEITRLSDLLRETSLAVAGRLQFATGRLSSGFHLVSERLVLISDAELFHRIEPARTSHRRLGRVIDSFLELREGDYVVHVAHGIGVYRGLKLLEKEAQSEEHLEVEFAAGTRIYVPAAKIDLVQKYVGGSKSRPTLSRIGGRTWIRQKEAARQAATDLASELLELQAARRHRGGIRYPADTEWQKAFDAAFPYVETPDQRSALEDVKADMQQARPMDRLLCGDVGYGKTEVAMRAAFKAVEAGYQVAMLVPTTVLAEQHCRTFRSRMAEFPFEIAALSRFSTRRQQSETLDRLANGSVDIVIGTHRLAQADVRFQNLGMILIDEEQRFGVAVKERLKALRHIVDVLTLTATPIPRTLHMSLLGIRDISNLQTPPEDRLAVETRVTRFDEELVRHALLRELNRGGQTYFVHNRVADIELVAARLGRIVPEANIRIGHGQMNEHALEQVMLDFVDRKFDVLLATTIVESGLDIPNANTIFIDEADRYGLADLHQLRGRVGRYKNRAYCYLLVDPHKHLTPAAARRLRAIEEFSDMGAGFALAMRDLEIRGAGNLLGPQQSGHIAAVGYELYCNLLEQAVRYLKQMPDGGRVDVDIDLPGQAFLPRRYVPDMRLKVDLYRRLARAVDQEGLRELANEMADRFGPAPPEVRRLMGQAELRLWAHGWGIRRIYIERPYAVLVFGGRGDVHRLAGRRAGQLRVADTKTAYLPLDKDVRDADSIYDVLKSLLRPE